MLLRPSNAFQSRICFRSDRVPSAVVDIVNLREDHQGAGFEVVEPERSPAKAGEAPMSR